MRLTRRDRPAGARVVAAVAATVVAGAVGALVPGTAYADTVRDYQRWYLDALRISQAHQITKGEGVVVAVVDSGVDATHPDLRGQVLAGHGIGSSAPGDGRADPDSEGGHGTGMAGIIAGKGGGVDHVLGIAPKAKILPVALGTMFGPAEISQGIRWAADNGADVINVSLGGPGAPSSEETEAVRYALGKDAVVVVSTGNVEQGNRVVTAPANVPGTVAVSATAKTGRFWTGSASGPEVVIAAPGEKLIYPAPAAASDNGYLMDDSTSGAAAVASGVAALVRSRYPDLNAANVINRLIRTATDKGSAGRDVQYGFGAVNPMSALTASVSKVTGNPLVSGKDSGDGGTGGPKSEQPGTSAQDEDDQPPAVSVGYNGDTRSLVLLIGFAVLLVAIVVVLVIVNVRARRKRALAARPPVPPGGPWPGAPGGAARGTWTGQPPQPGAPPPGAPPPPGPWPGQQGPPPSGGQPGAPAGPGHPASPYGTPPRQQPGPGWRQPPAPPGGR